MTKTLSILSALLFLVFLVPENAYAFDPGWFDWFDDYNFFSLLWEWTRW